MCCNWLTSCTGPLGAVAFRWDVVWPRNVHDSDVITSLTCDQVSVRVQNNCSSVMFSIHHATTRVKTMHLQSTPIYPSTFVGR
jgi:hypothetical protein